MRKLTLLVVLISLLAFTTVASASQPDAKNFMAKLSGSSELPANASEAQGLALVQLGEDDLSIRFVLIAQQLDNPVAAHIHCGTATANGPVGVTLFSGGTAGSGRFDGVLSKGEVTSPDANNRCNWTSMEQVAWAIRNGTAYVNIHTNDGVAPTNTGPGDLASGEIRGQLVEAGTNP